MLAPKYLDLYLPIKIELEKQGHEIFYIEDETPSFYPYYRRGVIKDAIYKILHLFRNLDRNYKIFWDKIIEEKKVLSEKYDLFFCVNGTSLHPYFIKILEENNPGIYKSLYLWDTNKYYDFERFVPYFNKCYTFDIEDAKELEINYLPIYYKKAHNHPNEIYDAFCIGTLHDNRLQILQNISDQMDSFGLSYCFRIVYKPLGFSLRNAILYLSSIFFGNHEQKEELEYKFGRKRSRLLTSKVVPIDEYNDLMSKSRVVIDTDRENQKGLTPRLVWAIAMGKTIITTNKNVRNNPYCPNANVWIINRKDPIVTKEMFISSGETKVEEKIYGLEISNWVQNFIACN